MIPLRPNSTTNGTDKVAAGFLRRVIESMPHVTHSSAAFDFSTEQQQKTQLGQGFELFYFIGLFWHKL